MPVPFEVFESAIVGLSEVLQHTPLAVTEPPPSPITFPPLVAVVVPIAVMLVVVTVGMTTIMLVVNEISAP